jgi:cytochrome c oxidase subunit 4
MSDEHAAHHVNYFMVFIALCVCTALSVMFDLIDISNKLVLIVLVLGVAVAKALFVMTYFMHLKFEGRWKFVLLAPTIILAIGVPLALLPDVGLHYYHLEIPQNDPSVSVSHHGETEPSTEHNGH